MNKNAKRVLRLAGLMLLGAAIGGFTSSAIFNRYYVPEPFVDSWGRYVRGGVLIGVGIGLLIEAIIRRTQIDKEN